MINLLSCPCPSAGMLYDPSASLPLSICQHAAWSISCLPLYIWGHAARSFSCPTFVHLPTCWMIHLLLDACYTSCLSCPSDGMPCLYCPSVWPAAWSTSCPAWYRNECTNVPKSKLRIETKPKRFGVFQNFFSKKECFYLFQKLLNVTKTFCCVPEFFRNVTIYSKNFKTKQKRFGVFQNFFWTKQNFLNVLQNFKTKQTIYLWKKIF